MKKALSLLLSLCLAFCLCIPAFAADAPAQNALVEEAVEYYLADSNSSVVYIRFNEQVRGVSDALAAELLPGLYLTELLHEEPDLIPEPDVITAEDVSFIEPCEENGSRLELFVKTGLSGLDLHVTGLLDAQGDALECTVTQDRFTYETLFFRVDTDEMASILLGFYSGEHSIPSIFRDDDAAPLTEYCLVGETIHLPEGLSPALQNRAKLVCDGVELQENDDGAYTAVSGTGTVTYDVAGQFSAAVKLCIQTPQERRLFAAREAAKRPLVTSYLWMQAATVLPVLYGNYAGLAVLPVSFLLGLATLPLGYLMQVIWARYWM